MAASGEILALALERLRHPAASHLEPALSRLLAYCHGRPPTVADLDVVLSPLAGVRFEPQPPRRRRREPDVDRSYDGTIETRGVVPSREGSLHDVLNALVWASFPRAKRALHARQLAAMRAHVPAGARRMPNARARESDALAMLDEGGLLLVSPPQLVVASTAVLESGDVRALAGHVAGNGIEVQIFGHAVLEHLAEDRAGDPRASTYVVPGADGADAGLVVLLADPLAFQRPTPWPAVPVRALVSALRTPDPGSGPRIGLPAGASTVR